MDSPRPAARQSSSREAAESVVGFDPVAMAAPFVVRCAAAVFDYLVVIALPAASMISNRAFGGPNVQDSLISGSTAWLLGILLGLCNSVLLPALNGQSVGKMVTGLRIVRTDGRNASMTTVALRNTLGYLATAATLGIGFVVAAVLRSGRSLHDVLFGTVVVSGVRRRRPQQQQQQQQN
ncbi:MAG: RDD family protein [Pyrinomonadaceae bacterium]